MDDSAVENTALPAAGNAAEPAPAKFQHSRKVAPEALGHLKHTRELFWHYWAPVLTMLTLIALQSTEVFSGAHTGEILGSLLRWLGNPLGPEALGLVNLALRKTGHVIGYGLLCLSWLLLLRGSYWLRRDYQLCLKGGIQVRRLWWRPVWGALALLCTAAVAVADELHQMGLPGRTGCVRDMLLDISAAVVAAAIVWYRARRRCNQD
jgi:VanZ like protein